MMAANSLMPYMPRLLTEKVPLVNSAGFSLPAFACAHSVHGWQNHTCISAVAEDIAGRKALIERLLQRTRFSWI